MFGLGSKDVFPYFFWFQKPKTKRRWVFLGCFPTFVGIPFGFCCFWFYVIKSQNQQKLEFLLFFSLFLWNSFAWKTKKTVYFWLLALKQKNTKPRKTLKQHLLSRNTHAPQSSFWVSCQFRLVWSDGPMSLHYEAGEVGCCESRMAERIYWWTERWLELVGVVCFAVVAVVAVVTSPQLLDVVWCSAVVVVDVVVVVVVAQWSCSCGVELV